MAEISRRDFIKNSGKTSVGAAVGLGLLAKSTASWAGANDKVRVAVLGIRGRGRSHLSGFWGQKNTEVVAMCDPDSNLFADRVKEFFTDRNRKKPKLVQDMREIMDDKDIDVVSIATPNHWHSLAGIWACEAGKDVYVEKPCSHNVFEGRQLVNAARKHNRVVQHGTQIRSSEAIREAMELLHDGVIGEVYMARGLCYKTRGSIGNEPNQPVPDGVDFNLWLGPAQERPFNPNTFHYNWHWMWDTGNGDIGNQGVHQMDLCRWGLNVGLPERITTSAGMFLWDDDKEVPNVITSSFEYPNEGEQGKMMVFEVRPWHTNDEGGAKIGALFYGKEGYMVIDSYTHYQVYFGDGKEGPSNNRGGNHYGNFIDAVRARDTSMLNAEIEEGHLSSALCHLGLISHRVKRSIEFDPKTEQIIGDKEAAKYLTRDYRKPFEVPKIA